MADVGDQGNAHDSPTTPFRKIVLPAEETVRIRRPPAPRPVPPQPQAQPQPQQQPQAQAQQPQPQAQAQPQQRQRQAQQQPQQPQAQPQQPQAQPPSQQQPPPAAPRPIPPSPPPPRRSPLARIGDIPIRVVYLIGAILATVAAVLLIFMLFSGDVPTKDEQTARIVPVAPVPSSATPTASSTPTPTVSEIALPPVPKTKVFATLPGTASVVTGLINDTKNGISYPRLGDPWTAKSFPPFTVAQRVGKVAVPHTVIASAMFPADSPEAKPSTDADYREIAVRAARWTLRTQYPAGATLAWTGSQKLPVGKGWTLAFKVTYTLSGKRQSGQALVSVVEVGKTKPAMLLASIPQSGKSHWRDLNTLATRIRPL